MMLCFKPLFSACLKSAKLLTNNQHRYILCDANLLLFAAAARALNLWPILFARRLMTWTHNKSASEYDLRPIEKIGFASLCFRWNDKKDNTKSIGWLNISEEIKIGETLKMRYESFARQTVAKKYFQRIFVKKHFLHIILPIKSITNKNVIAIWLKQKCLGPGALNLFSSLWAKFAYFSSDRLFFGSHASKYFR